MKRKSLIAVIAAVMVMASTAMSFAAGGFTLKSSYPENNQKNTSIENLGVKLQFSGKISKDEVKKADSKLVKLVDADGVEVPVQILFSDDEKGLVLVVADVDKMAEQKYTVKNNSTYQCVIGADFADDEGNTLGDEQIVAFTTYNQKMNNIINGGMMFVLFGGIMFMTMRQNKQKEEDDAEAEKKPAVNVYREAKRTGKSVEQIKAEIAKEEEKAAKKRAKKNKGKVEEETHKHIENCAKYLNNVYHVHAPAPVSKEDRSVDALRRARKAEKKAAKEAKNKKKK